MDKRQRRVFVTYVYAFPQPNNCKSLWAKLGKVGATMGNVPWCIGGNMNAWLYIEDKKVGVRVGQKLFSLFND